MTTFTLHTAAERPDLWARGIPSAAVWPEYNLHGDVLNLWWGHLDEELPDFQFVLYDEERDAVVAEGHTGPLWWDGDDASLPDGIDRAIEQVFGRLRAGQPVNTLCALAAESPREDGTMLDPWMRVHERLGARVATPLPRSLRITGTVAEWESWTGMAFPESDRYVFPEGLAPVRIDRAADRGFYWEPNVWMVHPDLTVG